MALHTYYDNLQVSRSASDEVVKGAYKCLSQKWHPDKHPPDKKKTAERYMALINEAYAVLSDPVQRREHDQWIAAEEAKQKAAEPADKVSASSSATEKIGLSAEAKEVYARAIARGYWPVALLWYFLGVSIFSGLLLKWITPLNAWSDEHPIITLAIVLAWIGGGAATSVSDKRKSILSKHDDDSLRLLYDQSSKRRALAGIILAVLAAGGIVAFAVVHYSTQQQKQVLLNSTDSDLKSHQTDTAPLNNAKVIHVKNGCDDAVRLHIAYKLTKTATQWSTADFDFNVGEEANLRVSQDGLLAVDSADSFWRAESLDGRHIWRAEESDRGMRFLLDGELSEKFKEFRETQNSRHEINLTCGN